MYCWKRRTRKPERQAEKIAGFPDSNIKLRGGGC